MRLHLFASIFKAILLAECHTITAPAQLQPTEGAHLELRQNPSAVSKEASSSSRKYCYSEPACSNELSRYDECTAEYGTNQKYLYCLCTNGYYDLGMECSSCDLQAGIITSINAEMTSYDSSRCASLAVVFGNATSTPSDFYKAGISISSSKFTGTATLSSSVAIPTDNFFSGLVAGQPTASPSSSSSGAVPISGAFLVVILSVAGWIEFSFLAFF